MLGVNDRPKAPVLLAHQVVDPTTERAELFISVVTIVAVLAFVSAPRAK